MSYLDFLDGSDVASRNSHPSLCRRIHREVRLNLFILGLFVPMAALQFSSQRESSPSAEAATESHSSRNPEDPAVFSNGSEAVAQANIGHPK